MAFERHKCNFLSFSIVGSKRGTYNGGYLQDLPLGLAWAYLGECNRQWKLESIISSHFLIAGTNFVKYFDTTFLLRSTSKRWMNSVEKTDMRNLSWINKCLPWLPYFCGSVCKWYSSLSHAFVSPFWRWNTRRRTFEDLGWKWWNLMGVLLCRP